MEGSGRAWLFVFKACVALLFTGWIAMRLGLENPGTAMLTCAIVINPQSGTVVAKSFYRGIGTLVGALASVGIVAAFPQQRVLLLAALALWLGVCAGGASLHRNFKSYGFVLAGYTATIVALPAVNDPTLLFDSAVMRVSEVLLGILVAGVVSDAIAPQRLSQTLRGSVRAQFTGFMTLVAASLANAPERSAREQAHLGSVREVMQVENLRSSVVFEDAGVRVRSPRLRRVNQRYMAASTSYQTLHNLMNRLRNAAGHDAHDALFRLFAPISNALSHVDGNAAVAEQAKTLALLLEDLRAPLRTEAMQLRDGLHGRSTLLDFDTGVEVLLRFVEELEDYAHAYVDLAGMSVQNARIGREAAGFVHGNDWLGAALIAVRTTAVMLVMGTLWIATAWAAGALTMLIATVFCGLLASAPNPLLAVRNMWKGFLIGGTVAFVWTFGVLVHMDGYLLFAVALLPVLIAGYYLFTRPAWMAMAQSIVMAFLIFMEPVSVMQFDAPAFIDQLIALMLGVGAAGVAFGLFANAANNRFLYGRLTAKLRGEVARACRGPLSGALARLESASRDLFMQIMGYTDPDSEASKQLQGWALSVLEVGRAVVDLRTDLQTVPEGLRRRIQRVVADIDALYEMPGRARYAQALRSMGTALNAAAAADAAPVLRHLHLARLTLLDGDSVLAPYVSPDVPRGEAAHAA